MVVSSFFTLKFLGQVILFPRPCGKECKRHVACSSKRGAEGKCTHPLPPLPLPHCPTISHLVLQLKPNRSLHERKKLCWYFFKCSQRRQLYQPQRTGPLEVPSTEVVLWDSLKKTKQTSYIFSPTPTTSKSSLPTPFFGSEAKGKSPDSTTNERFSSFQSSLSGFSLPQPGYARAFSFIISVNNFAPEIFGCSHLQWLFPMSLE